MSFRGSFRGGAGGGAARGGFDGKMSVMTQVRKEKEVETARLHAKTFQAWMNAHLRKRDLRIEDLANDCKDGIMLINLLEIITNTTCPSKYTTSPKLPAHYIANVTIFLEYLNQFVTVNVNPPDIVDGNIKIILSVIWRVILFFQVQSKHDQTPENAKQPAARANREAKAKLMTWVSEKTGLQITDCENSFGDGVAFCRLIQAYDASLIPDHMIQPGNPLHNLSMAFDIAETLGVPKLLDPLDLTNPNPECRPDEQCIMTYLSEYPKLFLAKPATAYQTPLGADAFRPDPNSVISSLASININIPASALSSFSPSGSSSSSSPLPAYPGAVPGSIPSGSQSPVPQGGRYTFNPLVPGAAPDQSALPPGSAPTLKPNFGPGGIPTGSTIPGGIPGSIPGSNSPGGSVPGSYGVGGGAGGATGPGALPPFDPSMMSASFDPRSLGLDPNNPSSYLGGSGGPGGQPFGSFAPGSGSGVGVGVGAGPGGLDAPSRPPPPKSAFTPVVGGSESAPDGHPTSGAFNAAGPGGLDYQSLGLGSLPLGSGFPGGQTGGFAGGTASGGSPLGSMDPMWASKEAEFKAREAEWQKKEEERARMEEQWRLQLQQKALEQQQLQQQLEALKAEQARLLSRAADPAVVEQNQVMAEQISRLRSRLVGQLRVFVAEARSLRGGSGINPYCTLTLDRYREKTGKVKKSQNPRWNQEFNFFVTEQNWVLNVTVYDHKTVGAHEFLGKIDIPINQLEDGRPLSRWFELQAKKPGGKVSGEIKLDIDYKFES